MKSHFLVICLLLIPHIFYAQQDSLKIERIQNRVSEIIANESANIILKDTILDDAEVSIKYYENTILTTSRLKNQDSKLKMNFYFDKGCLISIIVIEPSPYYNNDTQLHAQISILRTTYSLMIPKYFGIPMIKK